MDAMLEPNTKKTKIGTSSNLESVGVCETIENVNLTQESNEN